jgi:hypothetical protein
MGRTVLVMLPLAAALLPMPAHSAGPWSLHRGPRGLRALADGRAETPSGSVAAVLRVQCQQKDREPFCVSLKVEDASKVAGFDFAAFEGGAVRGQRLLRARAGADVALEAEVAGHWAKDPEGSFAFDLCGGADDAGEAATLARAIADVAGEVELAVQQPAGAAGEIRARFPADAVDHAVSEVLERCSSR